MKFISPTHTTSGLKSRPVWSAWIEIAGYDITPEDVYPKAFFDRYPIGSWHACFELLQPVIGKDLAALGVEKIYSYGYLD